MSCMRMLAPSSFPARAGAEGLPQACHSRCSKGPLRAPTRWLTLKCPLTQTCGQACGAQAAGTGGTAILTRRPTSMRQSPRPTMRGPVPSTIKSTTRPQATSSAHHPGACQHLPSQRHPPRLHMRLHTVSLHQLHRPGDCLFLRSQRPPNTSTTPVELRQKVLLEARRPKIKEPKCSAMIAQKRETAALCPRYAIDPRH